MNKEQQAVYNSLSTREYTAARDFAPRLEGLVPRKDVHKLLKELEAEGLAELAWGMGWRAIETENSADAGDRELYEAWKEYVKDGMTVLGYPEWVRNYVITQEKKEEDEGGK